VLDLSANSALSILLDMSVLLNLSANFALPALLPTCPYLLCLFCP
jgi:hypothetical protein